MRVEYPVEREERNLHAEREQERWGMDIHDMVAEQDIDMDYEEWL